jgi:Zn-dependent protease
MFSTGKGSLRLFNLFGITVFLHWSWFLVGAIELQYRAHNYASFSWNLFEYLALFVIVLMHEFGHSLACRQVGGKSETIVLWPFGGVAFVNPPPRPGAYLWSIAAGPLVNVIIGLLLWPVLRHAQESGWAEDMPDTLHWLTAVFYINAALFIFNMLPIYPLDGGQILRSLLWYVCSAGRSLQIAAAIGFIGIAALVVYAVKSESIWLGFLCYLGAMRCVAAWKSSQLLLKLEKLDRWPGFRCPNCHQSPTKTAGWPCEQCHQPLDPFLTQATCQHCGHTHAATACPFCQCSAPLEAWKMEGF